MKHLPVIKLQDRTSIGLEIRHTSEAAFRQTISQLEAHRDDNYLFILVEHGTGSLLIDFAEVTLSPKTLCCIRPGQIHHRVLIPTAAQVWVLAIAPNLVPPDYRAVFDNPLAHPPPIPLDDKTYLSCRTVVQLLSTHGADEPQAAFHLPVSRSLLETFLGLAARSVDAGNLTSVVASRPVQLAQAFRQLLTERVQTEKRPVAYAGYLNISETYLNEVVKSVTGFTVTYWVQHEVLLQAKRLLVHTELTVKEIAQQLGYDDPPYFSRLFKKATRTTPLAFREDYRK